MSGITATRSFPNQRKPMDVTRILLQCLPVLPAAVLFPCQALGGAPVQANAPLYSPAVHPASGEAEAAIAGFEVAEPFSIELFAAEPLLANPVLFHVANDGRVFVAETYRQGDDGGVVDNRYHPYWLLDDIANERVEQRREMFLRHRPDMAEQWTAHHGLIRVVEDKDGDGKADDSSIFADGFNDLMDGTAAGVLERNGKVWFTNIPHVWLLEDRDRNGYAEERTSLSYGYGVSVALRGHDLHGPAFGPDGKIYFSIGDRGYNVVTQEGRHLKAPNEGAVFRCDRDGSNLEVFATGLRNPQDLVFDNYGNLFTGDNNSDAADEARWTYVVEGGDSGWRMPYQTLPDRGPFNRLNLWQPEFDGRPAFAIPPIANISDGPSGVAFDPGTGMPEKYRGYFYLCDFRATPARSGVWAIAHEPDGAGFALVDSHPLIWNIVATDISVGPDSALYVSDWVSGWEGANRGRLYRLFDGAAQETDLVRQTRTLLREGMSDRSDSVLLDLLGHPNRRVRQEAQFTLAEREGTVEALAKLAASRDKEQLARVHAIWGLWQLLDENRDASVEALLPLLDDSDAEIRAQAARVLGDKAVARATENLIALLNDSAPRPVYFAAIGLGRIGDPRAIDAVAEMLRRNADRDPFLRHAGVMAFTGAGRTDERALLARADDESRSVRLGVLLALRRLDHPKVAKFLADSDPFLVREAALAIHDDTLIVDAIPTLAEVIKRPEISDEAVLRRAINANFRLGGLVQARDVAAFAAREEAPVVMRVEALHALRDWHEPPPRDRVIGFWRPLTGRPWHWAIEAVEPLLDALLRSSPQAVQIAAADLAGYYQLNSRVPLLQSMVEDAANRSDVRRAALQALGEMDDKAALGLAVTAALASDSADLRKPAYELLARLDPAEAVRAVETLVKSPSAAPNEKQAAFKTLAGIETSEARQIVLEWMNKLSDNPEAVPEEVHFELIQAAKNMQAGDPRLRAALDRFEKGRAHLDPAERTELLYGGDVALGKKLVFEHPAASCQRCHIIEGKGSSDVGPDLSTVGARLNRVELLRSLIDPGAAVAPGFGNATIRLTGGETVAGTVTGETSAAVSIEIADGEIRQIPRQEIASMQGPVSIMPPMGSILTEEELRAIVAYLAKQK